MKKPHSIKLCGFTCGMGVLVHFTPFQELERGQDIYAYGRHANGPFCVGTKTEGGKYKQEDASEHPGGISDHSEQHKITINLRTEYIGSDEQRVAKHNQCQYIHHHCRSTKEFCQRLTRQQEEKPAREGKDRVRVQNVVEGGSIV